MRNREDWLINQIDSGKLSPELEAQYETELDELAEYHNKAEERRKEAQAKEDARRAEIRARLLADDLDVVTTIGYEEFGNDYDIVQEQNEFVVYSKVAREDQTHRRVHRDLDAAEKDKRYLVRNRMYSKYVRSGEVGSVFEVA